jgi:Zn-dependent protease
MQFDWFSGLMSYAVFVFSTTLHEAAHALAALKMGDDTAHRGGQVTLDPLPHIRREPVGMVAVPLISWFAGGSMVGWASAPYDPDWARRYPRRAALMAGAGPLVNLMLVVITGLLMKAGLAAGVFQVPAPADFGWAQLVHAGDQGVWPAVAALLSLVFSLNLLLGLFNLLPLPPLDGSSLVKLLLPSRAAEVYTDFMSHPGFSLLGLLVAWKLFGQLFWPAWLAAVNLLYLGVAINY